ncbi:hypothetical protein DAPK24_037490 [Pichia kluyveri]|uniref:Uncharacterized protein n=1 Tax=Pichia kluyveri TaxID=36015 RepID=A0AAV5R6R5_PICKL|nr:hypothetical protein DAPK24_037490 [Pichia kluyveri]
MLRRDPTTIHLVAEDFRGLGLDADFETIAAAAAAVAAQTDNQNETSIDESYLGIRSNNNNRDIKDDNKILNSTIDDDQNNVLDSLEEDTT